MLEPDTGVVRGSRVLMRARSMKVWRTARRTCGCASSSQMAISCARCSTSSGVFSPASCARSPVIQGERNYMNACMHASGALHGRPGRPQTPPLSRAVTQ